MLAAWSSLATPLDKGADCRQIIGNDWMDYPDLAFSDNYLYVGVDHAIQGMGQAHVEQNCPTGGCNIIPHYVQFGREADLFPPPPSPPPR